MLYSAIMPGIESVPSSEDERLNSFTGKSKTTFSKFVVD